ncbi:conjugal transfer protein TraB [Thermococcus chitonophagus]|uniref:Conjugal transfer protein TraB n=1 Tax=Thermococcus chitonophagus TaxID=54262 RepID=A0A160VTI4_9EURY|nr:TraB/GumN family protein [Thermococcus chitonophagus]ASJ16769.1 conjugal transfer protein TraB [Thermococcus chitonophagus]CUX78240.1 Pheromone shutdown protein [Thermococcus chitonophagus]
MSYLRYVKVIGTVHVLPESVEEVRRSILQESPDAVAIELDYGRLMALLGREELTLAQALKLGRVGILGYILQEIEKFLGKDFGALPGEEMIEAYELATSLGIPIYLIDQPVQITLQKLLSGPRIEILRGLAEVVLLPFSGREVDIRDYRLLEHEFRIKYPYFYKVLVEERNIYMARNLMMIVDSILTKKKKAKVIAVVGLGHKRGIERILNRYTPRALKSMSL